jgi:non-specific serine/threonine protein kinase/serine/threonine-protein kinase
VQYAHLRLVIHRDLKPGNILVAADGAPKLLDFGIAKLLRADEAPATLTGLPLMTPEYASPEQVKGEPVTTASDIYSLGVLLYELLARRRPYEIKTRAPEEVARVVCQVEPRRPSAVAPPALARQLAGDLDAIALKALRKEPQRRYASVQELSEDLGRHLAALPVRARGDRLAYLAGKFAQRHKAAAAAAALVALSLVGGIVATARQARIAERNRARAERRFDDVRSLARSFLFDFHDAVANVPGTLQARELVVKRGLEYLDSLAAEAGQDVALRRELAAGYQRLGDVQGGTLQANRGDTKGALASYQKAFALRRALAAAPGEPQDEEALAAAESALGRILFNSGDPQAAEDSARSAARRLEGLAGKSDVRDQLASAYGTLGYVEGRRGKDPLPSLEKAVSFGSAWCAAHPDDRTALAMLARNQGDVAGYLGARGDYKRAAEIARSSWAVLEKLIVAEPLNAAYRRALVRSLNIGSEEVENAGDPAAANQARRRSLQIAEALAAAEPGNQGDQIVLGYSLHWLGGGLVRTGEPAAGLDFLRRAVKVAQATIEADPANDFARERLAEIQTELGLALRGMGKRDAETCAALRQSVEYWQNLERNGRLPGGIRYWFERAARATCPR